jgi:colicin import membrane protein
MTSLVVIEKLNAVEVFSEGGIKPVIAAIRASVEPEVYDLTTDKGRKLVASNAHLVAKSKTALDGLGKSLADKLNAQLKPINAERKLAREMLEDLRDEIRKPLTLWEGEQAAIAKKELEEKDAKLLAVQVEADHEIALLLDDKYTRDAADEKAAKDAAEAASKLAATEERKKQDEAIAKQSAQRARQAAKDKITAANNAVIAAEDRAKAERLKAEQDAEAAARRASDDKALAIETERKRVAAEREAEKAAAVAREADKKHHASINNAALNDFVAGGMDVKQAKLAVQLIASRLIAHVTITY